MRFAKQKEAIKSRYENYKNVISRKVNEAETHHSPFKLPETKRVKMFNALKEHTSVPSIIAKDKKHVMLPSRQSEFLT